MRSPELSAHNRSSSVARPARKLELVCSRCGYGIVSRERPEWCPMCGTGAVWAEAPGWSGGVEDRARRAL